MLLISNLRELSNNRSLSFTTALSLFRSRFSISFAFPLSNPLRWTTTNWRLSQRWTFLFAIWRRFGGEQSRKLSTLFSTSSLFWRAAASVVCLQTKRVIRLQAPIIMFFFLYCCIVAGGTHLELQGRESNWVGFAFLSWMLPGVQTRHFKSVIAPAIAVVTRRVREGECLKSWDPTVQAACSFSTFTYFITRFCWSRKFLYARITYEKHKKHSPFRQIHPFYRQIYL